MTLWIKVHSNLLSHPKTSRLADILKLSSRAASPDVVAAGMLVSLWTWAIQNAWNGDLSGCSDRTITEAARCRLKPEVFVKALTDAGWLDADRHLHDWEEYTLQLTGMLDRQKQKTRERVRRYRNRSNATVTPPPTFSAASCNGSCNASCNVTETLPKRNVTVTDRDRDKDRDNNISLSRASIPSTDITPPGIPAPPKSARAFDAESFSLFWEAYPTKNGKKTGREAAWKSWQLLAPSKAQAGRILSNLEAWKRSGEWLDNGDRYIPFAANFLASESYYDTAPAPSKRFAIPKGASGQLGEAELEAIQRVLKEE